MNKYKDYIWFNIFFSFYYMPHLTWFMMHINSYRKTWHYHNFISAVVNFPRAPSSWGGGLIRNSRVAYIKVMQLITESGCSMFFLYPTLGTRIMGQRPLFIFSVCAYLDDAYYPPPLFFYAPLQQSGTHTCIKYSAPNIQGQVLIREDREKSYHIWNR